MAYTEVTRQSWFSRIGGAIKGVLLGVVLVIVAFPILFLNEGRAVRRHRTLTEGAGLVESIGADSPDEANHGKLVHVSGRLMTDAVLEDTVFGVSANAIHLKRDVEMFQWRENVQTRKEKKVGGAEETTRTYTYDTAWSSTLINSDNFKDKAAGHENPRAMPYEARSWTADAVTLGAFRLSPNQIGRVSTYAPLEIPADTELPEALGERAGIHDSRIYIGANPATPEVGDVRVTFTAVDPTEVSIVAKQTGNTFEAYTTSGTGGSVDLLLAGIHSADAMFASAVSANRMTTWILRLVGFGFFLVGFNMVFRPFSVVADVLPIMGRIVGAGTGLIAFLLASVLSLSVISVAWVFYRPMIGIPLLILAVGLVVVAVKKLKEAKAPAVAEVVGPGG